MEERSKNTKENIVGGSSSKSEVVGDGLKTGLLNQVGGEMIKLCSRLMSDQLLQSVLGFVYSPAHPPI